MADRMISNRLLSPLALGATINHQSLKKKKGLQTLQKVTLITHELFNSLLTVVRSL